MNNSVKVNITNNTSVKGCLPLVDIIVAAYNEENHIERCIKCVEAQNYDNYNMIIVDDGSTDNTLKIAQMHENKNPKIKVVHQGNHGTGHARNTGLKHLKGEYLCPLDSDDTIDPDYIETLVSHADDADLVSCGIKHVFKNDPGTNFTLAVDKNETLVRKQGDFIKLFENKYWNIVHLIAGSLFKNSIIENNNILFCDLNYGEDTRFIFDYLQSCSNVLFLKYAGYNYYQNKSSLSQQISIDTWTTIKSVMDYCRKDYFKKYDDFWSDLMSKIVFGALFKCKDNQGVFTNVAQSIVKDDDFSHINNFDIFNNGFSELFDLLKDKNWDGAFELINR